MIDFNQLNNDVVIQNVKQAFLYSMTPLIENNTLNTETANRYFKTIFESPDLVEMIRKSLASHDNRLQFSHVNYVTDIRELVSNHEFEEVKFHSYYDDFTVYVKEIYEPRDVATYFSILFRPHEHIARSI